MSATSDGAVDGAADGPSSGSEGLALGVARGTRARPPAGLSELVERVFADRRALAERYVAHLTTSGIERGLVGPREAERVWERHVLNCAAVAALCPRGASVADVGSGAGLPGLVIALARPDLRVVLVEPLQRRVDWLREVVDDLGLPVEVLRARAEESGLRVQVVTARAVAPLDRLARWCLPLVAPGGSLLAMKGRSAADEVAAAAPVLRRLGAVSWEVLSLHADGTPAAAEGHADPEGASPAASAPDRPEHLWMPPPTTVVRATVRSAR